MRRLLSLLLPLLLLLAGCGDSLSDREGEGPGGTTAPPEPAICPLTGVEASVDITRPALAVKIDNAPPARPQAGLQGADLVWEEIGEGGLTRFLSIFHCSDASLLGPVRSARTVDPDIMQEYQPVLFGYSGANDEVLAKVRSTQGVVNLVHNDFGDAYTRESSRRAPYNLFTTTEALRGLPPAQDVKGPPKTGFVFDAAVLEPPAEGAPPAPPGNSVTFSYSNAVPVRWTYDPASKKYLRFHGDTAHKLNSGEQVSATNVVILKVRVVTGHILDASGSPTLDTTVTGTGEAIVLRGGTSVTGTWSRASLGANTTLTDTAGNPIQLAPGNTWVQLMPQERAAAVQ